MEISNGIFHKGGGSRVPLSFFQKCFIKKHLEPFRDCQNLFTLSLGFRNIHIVIVTRNVAEYTSSWQPAARAAEECQYCRCQCASSISDPTNFCNVDDTSTDGPGKTATYYMQ